MAREITALSGLVVLLTMMATPAAAQAQTAQTVLRAAADAMGTD